jgi:hypothetical protein
MDSSLSLELKKARMNARIPEVKVRRSKLEELGWVGPHVSETLASHFQLLAL